jgi:3-mercaptopyruvate sulfurtransferase SseA
MALKLKSLGIREVRPLGGGFGEWKRRGYPLEDGLEKIGWRATASPA